jgi:chemotaxis signal transduction protein
LRLSANCAEDVPNLVNTEVPEHYIKGIGKLKDRLLVLLDLNNIITPEEFKNVERHLKAVPA